MKSRTTKVVLGTIAVTAALVAGWMAMHHGPETWAGKFLARFQGESHDGKTGEARRRVPRIEIVAGRPDTIRFTDEAYQTLGVQTVEVQPAPPPDPLRLPGSLVLDPNRLVRIHSRFTGELIQIGNVNPQAGNNAERDGNSVRTLRYGDYVKKGDVLAIVWSKEIGEKKSELVDAISKLDADQKLLERLEATEKGVVAEKVKIDARRTVQADAIALARAERTLRSWRLSDQEIGAIYREADDVRKRQADTDNDKTWAELEIKAPIDGLIVEKSVNEGAMINPDDVLFQVADLSQLMVLANIYEEDLPALRKLEPSQHKWLVDLKSDPDDKPREGSFDLIGTIIDPEAHTGVVMGWLDNSEAHLAAGQFITATIVLPADPNLVTIPTSALIEQGDASYVLVETNAERHEFTRHKVDVKRRWRHSVYVCRDRGAEEANGCGPDSLKVGEKVIVTGVLELSAEFDAAQSRSDEQK
ncbi:MAG TPA: efflux RND transporter periplasmic adaptor subunit [Planctomycetaceae bacterium]